MTKSARRDIIYLKHIEEWEAIKNSHFFKSGKEFILRNYKYFLIFAVLSLGSYITYILPHLASDSYCFLSSLDESGAILNGRPVAWVFLAVMKALNLNYVANPLLQIITNSFAVLSLSIAAAILFSQLKQKTLLTFFAVAAIFVNAFFVDIMQFPELSPQFQFSLVYAASASAIINKSTIPLRLRLVLSLVLIILVAGSYQTYLAYFVIFSVILYIQNLSDENFDKAKTFWSIIAVYAAGCAFTFAYFKLFLPSQNRVVFSDIPIADNIRGIYYLFFGILKNGSGILPYLSVAALFITALVAMLKTTVVEFKTNRLMPLLGTVGMLIATFLHCITAAPNQFCVSQRSTVACLAIPMAMILISLNRTKRNTHSSKHIFLTGVVGIFLLINIITINILGAGLQKVNSNDKQEFKDIANLIMVHEKENGKIITKIAFVHDKEVLKYRDGILSSYDINARSLSYEWSIVPGVNYFLKRELLPVDFDEEKSGISLSENYTHFSSSNVRFADDTVYIVVY